MQEGVAIIRGEAKKVEEDGDKTYLHRGIARRAFERRFDLADHIQVTGAALENGLLHIDLKRPNVEAEPRTIEIRSRRDKRPSLKAVDLEREEKAS